MKKEVLNKKEKEEITTDVKDALSKAIEKNSYDNTMNQDEIDVKKFKLKVKPSKRISIIVSVLIIIFVFLLGLNWFLSNNPRTIFFGSIDGFFEKVESFITSDKKIIKGEISINHGNDKNSNYIYYFDRKNDKLLVQNLDNGFKLVVQNNNLYFYDSSVSNNYVLYDSFDFSFFDLRLALEDLNKGLDKVLVDQKFNTSLEDANVSGKNLSVIVTTLSLDAKRSNFVVDDLKDYLRAEKDFVNFYNFLMGNNNAFNKAFDSLKGGLTLKVYSTERENELVKVRLTNDDVMFSLIKNDNAYEYSLSDDVTNSDVFGKFEYVDKKVVFTKNTDDFKMRVLYNYEKTDRFKKIDISNAVDMKSLDKDNQKKLISRYDELFKDLMK